MTKHLYRLSTKLQASLRAAAGNPPAADWSAQVARVELDAWAALHEWHRHGERVVRITEEQELAMLANPLPPSLPMASPLTVEALGIQLAEREDWVVVARIPAQQVIPVYREQIFAYRQAVIVYLTEIGKSIASGYLNIEDQPTVADLSLRPGVALTMDGQRELTEAEVMSEDYRLALAIHRLYGYRQTKSPNPPQ